MARYRASAIQRCSNGAAVSLLDDPPLFRLPTDVWLHIFAHIFPEAAPTFAALSATCRHLLRLVDEHAWKEVLSKRYGFVSTGHLDTHYQRCRSNLSRTQGPRNAALGRSPWWFACRYASLLQKSWSAPAFCSGSLDISIAIAQKKIAGGGGARRRRFGTDFAIPTLTAGSKYIIVGVRSELFLYHTRRPTSAKVGDLVARIKLNSRSVHVQNDQEAGTDHSVGSVSDDPWQDITAVQELDQEGTLLVVGYADGCVQVLSLKVAGEPKERKQLGAGVELLHHIPCRRRQEIVGVSVFNPVRSNPLRSTTYSASKRLKIVSLSKRGHLRMHYFPADTGEAEGVQTWSWHIDTEGAATISSDANEADVSAESSGTTTPRPLFRSVAFNNAPLVSPLEGVGGSATRAWSVLLGSSTALTHRASSSTKRNEDEWVAVGITAEYAVYIYPLLHHQSGDPQLGDPFRVASTGQRTSVYAMATAPAASSIPSFLLFVGFYDGVVRVYDTRQLQSVNQDGEGTMDMHLLDEALASNGTGANHPPKRKRLPRELNPIAIFREDYDHDAIYSLSFGGPSATLLIVGGARHAKVRIFDVSMLANYDVPLLSAPSCTTGQRGDEEQAGDWTAFALPSTDSPVYGIVVEGDRVVGVTDRKMWFFDFSSPILASEPRPPEHSKPVAYFRHRDGVLSYSHTTLNHAH